MVCSLLENSLDGGTDKFCLDDSVETLLRKRRNGWKGTIGREADSFGLKDEWASELPTSSIHEREIFEGRSLDIRATRQRCNLLGYQQQAVVQVAERGRTRHVVIFCSKRLREGCAEMRGVGKV
jgi:hypothetical protein